MKCGGRIANHCAMSGEIFVKNFSGGTGSAAGGAEFAKGNERGEIANSTGGFYLDIGWGVIAHQNNVVRGGPTTGG